MKIYKFNFQIVFFLIEHSTYTLLNIYLVAISNLKENPFKGIYAAEGIRRNLQTQRATVYLKYELVSRKLKYNAISCAANFLNAKRSFLEFVGQYDVNIYY